MKCLGFGSFWGFMRGRLLGDSDSREKVQIVRENEMEQVVKRGGGLVEWFWGLEIGRWVGYGCLKMCITDCT